MISNEEKLQKIKDYAELFVRQNYPDRDIQSIDIEAYFESDKSLKENQKKIKNIIKEHFGEKQETKADINADRNKAEADYRLLMKEQQNKLIEEWKAIKLINIPKTPSFFEVEHYIKMTAKGLSNGTIIIGEGGLGKTFSVISILNETKIPFVFCNNYSTPLAFYEFLYKHNKELIIFDDVENILSDNKIVSMLKSALWGVNNKRLIQYKSMSKLAENLPELFEFEGQMIILGNKIDINNKDLRALITRCNYCELLLSYGEKIAIMKQIAETCEYNNMTKEERLKVFSFIEANTTEATENLNFRTLIKCYDFYRYDMSLWEGLAIKCFKCDKKVIKVKELVNSGIPVNEQIREYIRFGGSRADYFRKKGMMYGDLRCEVGV